MDGGGYKCISRLIPRALDPINGNLLVTDRRNQGIYDLDINGEKPLYFSPIPEVPFPWGSVVVEGPGGEGLVYTATLPSKVIKRLLASGNDVIHPLGESKKKLPAIFDFLK